jgi:DNA repair exonuclease SbcCD ATPase subunit
MAQIIHISDIHIDIRNAEKIKVYEHVFENFVSLISKFDPNSTVIVIAGDIFHHKDTLTSEDIRIFKVFLHNIRNYPVVVIPGNHDASINNPNFSSIVSSILLNPDKTVLFNNVRYSEKTEFFSVPLKQKTQKIDFFHLSIYDPRDRKQIEDFFVENKSELSQCVFLYHGPVDGIDKYYSQNSRIGQKILEIPKITILGDYHDFRVVIENRVAYSGCLFRRTLADGSSKKGFIVWKIQGSTVEQQFIEIPNKFEPKTEDISKLSLKEAKEKLRNIDDNTYLIVNSQQSSSLSEEAKLKNVKLIPFIPRKKFRKNFFNETELIQQILRDHDTKTIEKVISLHSRVFRESGVQAFSKLTLLKLEFDNLFKYKKHNSINFEKLNGLCCIVGKNNTGKSSILRILLYGLFREVEEGSSLSDVINQTEEKGSVSITFSLEDENETEKYKIICSTTRKSSRIKFYKLNPDDTIEDLSGKDIKDTYKIIRQKIGSCKDFLLTSMQMQDTKFDIVKNKNFLKESIQHLTHMTEDDIKQIEKDIENQTEELERRIFALKQQKQKLENELQEITKKIELLRTELTVKSSRKQDLTEFLQKKTQELQELKDKIPSQEEDTPEIKQVKEQLKTFTMQEETRYQKFKALCEPIIRLIRGYHTDENEDCNYEKAIEVLSKLNKLKDKISLAIELNKDQSLLNFLKNEAEIRQQIDKISQQIEELSNELSGDSYEGLLEKKGRIIDGLEFNPDCEQCINNKKILKIEYTKPEIETKIDQCLKLKKLTKQKNDLSDNLSKISKIRYEEFLSINEFLKYSRCIRDIYEKRISLLEPSDLKKMALLKQKIQEHKIRVEEVSKRFQYSINQLNSEINSLQDQLDLVVTQITKAQEQMAKFQKSADIYNTEIPQIANKKQDLKERLQILELYRKKVLKQLPELAIKSVIKDLITEVNSLTLLTGDFRIELDDEYRIRILDKDKSIPLSIASGFQKFVVSLIFRICLTSMFPRTGDFLIIDEGFGCLDNENCNKVVEFLEYIRDKYKFILVITHVEKMKSLIDNQINIISDGSYSKVCY